MPLRAAFVSFASDLGATGQLVLALEALKQRLADPVADRVIETLRVAREVGGTELPSVLRALASHLRSDAALRSEVEARQSWVVSAARLGVAALLEEAESARVRRAESATEDGGSAVCAWNHFENIPTFYNWNNRPR